MWTVEGKTFDKYFKAYDYASKLSAAENREVEIIKQGQSKGVKIWVNRPGDPTY